MAYSAWSVVFGEQPSASKWNILGTNDASFADGTGISAGAILSSHFAPVVYTPVSGYNPLTTSSTSYVTALTQSVTIPSSGKIIVTGNMAAQLTGGAPAIPCYARIMVDTTAGTEYRVDAYISNGGLSLSPTAYIAHASGTFNVILQFRVGGGSFSIWNASMFIMAVAA